MSKKDEFKNFVSKNPYLINKVEQGRTTWQKLYEIYDLYGENNEVWNKYLLNNKNINEQNINKQKTNTNNPSNIKIKDILDNIKNMNIENVQKNISSLQKAVEFLTDITSSTKSSTSSTPKTFTQRPINKIFDD